ncbi:hypothetical protein O3G_MSEX015066 [Manduca sexta]|uniref:Uncharacterized protein n=1 Tax=Manduca sexta TaxID=7130 RepID=A0A922D1I0_MANSE|nr:hypothetical protein O3G_MSEX015066 [Manduca sexta]
MNLWKELGKDCSKGNKRYRKQLIIKKAKNINRNVENRMKSVKHSYNVENKMKSPTYDAEYVDYDQNYEEENTEKYQNPDYGNFEKEEVVQEPEYITTKRQKPRSKPKINKETKIYKEDYEESVKDPTQNQYGNEKIFQEVDLRNTNDSYEDYVTPDKEDIFESEETTTKQKAFRQTIKKYTGRSHPKDYEDVKARTESLLYDEKEVRVNRTIDGSLRNAKTKKGKGTMIPTRHYYKMSSPDYYKKLPVIAEKYNFDEPIPEKDREPENLKPIGNPPAKINKKVRL